MAARWLHPRRVADGRTVIIRRAQPGDRHAIQRFVQSLSSQSRYQRYFGPLRALTNEMLDRLVQADEAQCVALVALAEAQAWEIVGLAQYDAVERGEAEAAVAVGEGWRRAGLATALLKDLALFAAATGIASLRADILRENGAALALARHLGCIVDTRSWSQYCVQVVKPMTTPLEICAPVRESGRERRH